jgi:ParB family chromosome partitioning protein
MTGSLSNALNFAKKTVQNISLDNIVPDPLQPRKTFSDESIQELALNIKELGLMNPILVRKHPESEFKYIVIAGERRFRACSYLRDTAENEEEKQKWSRIEAKVSEGDDEVAIRAKQLAENVIREDLNPIERAEGLKAVYDLLKTLNSDITWPDVDKRVGVAERTRKRLLGLLKAPEEVKDAVRGEKLTQNDVEKFSQLPKDKQNKILADLREGKEVKVDVQKGKASSKKQLDPKDSFASGFRTLIKTNKDRLSREELQEIIGKILQEMSK